MGKKSRRQRTKTQSQAAYNVGARLFPREARELLTEISEDGGASQYKRLFETLRNQDPFHPIRLVAFQFFCEELEEKVLPNYDDYNERNDLLMFFKSIRRDEREPRFYRAKANFMIGSIHIWRFDPHAKALYYFDEASQLYKSATEAEKKKLVYLGNDPVELGNLYANGLREIECTTNYLLDKVSLEAWHPTDSSTTIQYSHIAGLICDCCAVRRDEMEGEVMLMCGNCKMAFYCSPECQARAWKEHRHQKECRKKGEFRQGDVAIVTTAVEDIKAGETVELVCPGPSPDTLFECDPVTGRVSRELEKGLTRSTYWVINKHKSNITTIESVLAAHLSRVRSPIWRAWTQADIDMIRNELGREKMNRNCEETDEELEELPLPHLLATEADGESDHEEIDELEE